MNFPQNVDARQFSQELRLEGENERFNWVGGAYYLNIDGAYDAGLDLSNALGVTVDNNYRLTTKSWAAFAQGQYWFTKRWAATLGLRWTDDKKRMVLNSSCIDAIPGICSLAFGGLVQVTGLPPVSRSEGDWSGTLRFDFKPNEDWLVYGGVTRGQKAGGFNAGAVTLFTPDQVEYRGEVLTSIEAGFKATLFDSNTRLNASVYHYDYKNFQTFSQLGGALVVFNVDAEVLGSEIEIVTRPWQRWEFMLGASLMDAKQKHLAFGGVTKDRPMPNAPDVSLNGLGRYEWPLAAGTMSAQVDFTYVDKRSLNAIDHPALIAGGYTVANARLSYTSTDSHWEGSIFVNNLSDKVYFPTMFDISTLTGSLQRIPGSPRWFGASVKYKWK
jgi:iron complex outermembrane receptor protein